MVEQILEREGVPEDYDEHFRGVVGTEKSFSRPFNYESIISFLPSSEEMGDEYIVDIGCGFGRMAKFMKDAGYKNYLGLDFSTFGIEYATKEYPEYDFKVMDLKDPEQRKIFKDYKFFVSNETLEHISDEAEVIKDIPVGSSFCFTVPDYPSTWHLRYFKNTDEIAERYKDYIEVIDTKEYWPEDRPGRAVQFALKSIRRDV